MCRPHAEPLQVSVPGHHPPAVPDHSQPDAAPPEDELPAQAHGLRAVPRDYVQDLVNVDVVSHVGPLRV